MSVLFKQAETKSSKKTILLIGIISLAILLFYQNCGNSGFSKKNMATGSTPSLTTKGACQQATRNCETSIGYGVQSCIDTASGVEYSDCVLMSCKPGFSIDSNERGCVADTCSSDASIDCPVTNGDGVRACVNGKYSEACSITCNAEAVLDLGGQNCMKTNLSTSDVGAPGECQSPNPGVISNASTSLPANLCRVGTPEAAPQLPAPGGTVSYKCSNEGVLSGDCRITRCGAGETPNAMSTACLSPATGSSCSPPRVLVDGTCRLPLICRSPLVANSANTSCVGTCPPSFVRDQSGTACVYDCSSSPNKPIGCWTYTEWLRYRQCVQPLAYSFGVESQQCGCHNFSFVESSGEYRCNGTIMSPRPTTCGPLWPRPASCGP